MCNRRQRSQKRSTELEVVAHEDDRLALLPEALERREALLLEGLVADGEHLVEQEDVEVDLDRDRVREPHLHARREVLQLLVDEALELGERDDLVEALLELALAQPEQRAVDADVVARRELEVEADAELDERREQPVDPNEAGVRAVDAGEDLQQRALAAAVRPDDSEELTRLDRERDVRERVVPLVRRPAERVQEVLLEDRPPLVRQPERLRDAGDLDRRRPSEPLREVAAFASEEDESRNEDERDDRDRDEPPARACEDVAAVT